MKYLPGRKIQGFTLVELIVVVGILAILLAVVLVALNPAQRFQDTNNARRQSDINAVLNAVHQRVVDQRGVIPAGIVATENQLGTAIGAACGAITTGGCDTIAGGCVNLTADLITPGYIGSIPLDPVNGTDLTSRYTIQKNANNTITVRACDAEGGDIISVTR